MSSASRSSARWPSRRLRKGEQRYHDLFENANEPIATVSLDDEITEVNAAFERVIGYSRDELIGSNLLAY